MFELKLKKIFIYIPISLLINLLLIYFFPRIIYLDILFTILLIAVLKLINLDHKTFFFYSFSFLLISPLLILLKNVLLSTKISYYIFYTFPLAIILYLYEHKLEIKINKEKRKRIYLYLAIFLAVIFITLFLKTNIIELKSIIDRTFNKEEYFSEIDTIIINEKEYEKDILICIDQPSNYSDAKEIFKISGWAFDRSELEGSNIDGIYVYLDATPLKGGKLISKGLYNLERKDVVRIHKIENDYTGFECLIDTNSIENGVHLFYIYFHSKYFQSEYRELKLFVNN